MFFGTWIDAEGDYFDTAHFPNCLEQYPFQGGGCYLLLGTSKLIFTFLPLQFIMAKLPIIPDPKYSLAQSKSLETAKTLKEDVSMTQRKHYSQE